MALDFEPVERLQNIGPTIAKRLRSIGIKTRGDLAQAGAVATYLHLCASFGNRRLPVCYYLYSLEGALRGKHWDELGEKLKRSLLNEVEKRRAIVN